MEDYRTKLDKLSTRRDRAEKKLEEFMEGYYDTDQRKPNQVFQDESGDFKMAWTRPPHYMRDLMPTREDPKDVYLSFKKILTNNSKDVNAEGVISLIRRYGEALDPVVYMNMRTYTFKVAEHIEKNKNDPHYSRLEGLKDASRMLRLDHQAEFTRQLYTMQNVEEFKVPFCRSVSKSIEKIKNIYLLNKINAPFGVLPQAQRHEVAHLYNKKIPEDRYRPRERGRGGRGNRGLRGGRNEGRFQPYERDYRDRRDQPNRSNDQQTDTASRGSGYRGRGRTRGGRGRGRGRPNNFQPREQQPKNDAKQVEEKPTKESIWKHSDMDREPVINAFAIHDQ